MKNTKTLALLAVAGLATSLSAAPRESVTFTAVSSQGLINDADTTTLTATFTGSDGAGAYNATYLTVSGSITELIDITAQSEAAILITPPSGQPFICRPITTSATGTATIPAGAFVIPVGSFTTAGVWSFKFFELFNDTTTTIDARWDTITFTLDDGAPPTGANPGPQQNFTLTNIDVDGPATAPATRTFTAAAGDTIGLVRLSAVGTGRTASPTANSNVNPLSRARFQLVAPDGVTVSTIIQPWATATQSSSTAEATAFMNAAVPSGGTWTLRAWDTSDFAGVDSTLQTVTLSFLSSPTLPSPISPLPPTIDNTFVTATDTINIPGEVKWFSVVVPVAITNADYRGFDLDTEGSITTPTVNDTGAAIFNSNGGLVTSDSFDGTDSLASFSFGRGTRPAPGNGLAYNGRDGDLAAGTYYVAVVGGAFTTNAANPFGIVGTSTTITGTVNLNARYVSDTGGRPPTDAVQVALTEGVWNSATKALPAGGTAWFFFDLPTMPTGSVVDIDTEGSALVPANDTAIALYRTTTGAVEDQDNNDGTGLLSALSYGPGALIGAYSNSGVRFNGRDGTASGLGAPARYYVAVVGGDATTAAPATFQTGYITVPPVANAGTANLRVRYYTASAPSQTPPATPINLVNGGAWATATESIGISDVKWFTFTTPAFDATGALDIDVVGTNLLPVNDTDIALYTTAGVFIDSDDTDGPGELSQLSYGTGRRNSTGDAARFTGQDGTTAGTTGNVGPNTTYFLAVGTGTSTTHASTFNTQPLTGSLNGGSTTVRVRAWATAAPTDPVLPPASESLGNIDGNSTATDTETIPVGSVKWYVFSLTTPINALSNSALQIDTEGSSTSPTLLDTSIGLYNSNGTLAVSDSFDGSGSLGTLTFGADNRPAPGDGLPYAGRDGELLAGTYYLAVAPGGFPTFGADYAVTGLSTTQSGDVTTTIRTFSPSIAAATPPSDVEAIGLLGTSTPGAEAVTTRTHTVVNGNDVKWYSFAIAGEVNATNTFYVDIDTEGTGPGIAPALGNFVDTEIGLYSGIGALLGNDDDSGSDQRSALSFGSTTPVRPAVPTGTSAVGEARNGRNGRLIAGTYYLAVSTFSTIHNTSDFILALPTDRAASTGDRVVNLRTNLRRNACPNPSNVSGPGQNTVTVDEELTADDIIVFLNRFFANDLASNVSGPGQNTTLLDNELTADDIIVFLNRFFAGC